MAHSIAHQQSGISCGAAVELRPADMAQLAKLWLHRFSSRRQLRKLDAHLLQDIGLDPVAAEREAAKPFWVA